jgi:hypothetical protein
MMKSFLMLPVVLGVGLLACGGTSSEDEVATGAGAVGEEPAPPFVCEDVLQGQDAGGDGPAVVSKIRIAGHPDQGFDRMVLEFSNEALEPNFTVLKNDTGATFVDMAEEEHELRGSAGLLFIVRGATSPASSAPSNVKPEGTSSILEAEFLPGVHAGDLEYGVGLAKDACYRVFRLSNPPRLVLDVKR